MKSALNFDLWGRYKYFSKILDFFTFNWRCTTVKPIFRNRVI